MNKISLTLALALVGVMPSQAKPRTQAQMAQTAAKAIQAQMGKMHKAPRKGQLLTLAERGNLTVMGYADGGFAIVTADDLLPEVVAYSEKSYTTTERNDGFQWWLTAMEEAAAYYVTQL